MKEYQNPCGSCTREKCVRHCAAWDEQYLYRQKLINAYARKYGIAPDGLNYELGQNPCDGCRWNEECDSICQARARYWDEGMEQLRKEMGI